HAGHVVETAPTAEIIANPSHPYTEKLLRSVPSLVDSIDELEAIEGSLPDLRRADLPFCRFAERCSRRLPVCDAAPLSLEPVATATACSLEGAAPPQSRHLIACRNPL